VIAVLPPRERPATGRTRFQTLVTTDAIDRVELFLDGEPAGADETPPFSATLDLGAEPRPHAVRAVAYDRSGRVLGEHLLELNAASARAFSIAIRALDASAGGSWELEAEVVLPAGAALERVEVYKNQELLARLAEPPFRARVPGAAGAVDPSDYVRVVAYLADGTTAEDVRFLAAGVAGERVEVNLVELFAVVTGKDGEPVEGLAADDFEILLEGKPRPVERFQHADEVPLTLGLAVDTSGSMWPLMIDTRQAASRFLVNTLIPGDRALLVAFSNRPRLVAGPTGDLQTLLQGFGRLSAEGATALYDSIVFSLVQLQEAGEHGDGRRAVVLLTDGQDYGSRFRPRRVIDDARAQGTPVYVVSLAGLYNERGSVRKPDLEAIVGHTGGRIYYIENVSELGEAYDQINRELRTQYVLAFATDRPLTEAQLRSVRVRMKRPGLEARVAVEPGR
jgi:VWFA-related protein